jgi:hypothetical protein
MAPVERIFAHLVFQLELFSREPEVRVIQRVILVPFFGSNFWFPAVQGCLQPFSEDMLPKLRRARVLDPVFRCLLHASAAQLPVPTLPQEQPALT